MQPFSLEELGLSPDEIAALDSVATPPPAEDASFDIGAMQPFSLEELGLSPDEIASLSGEPILSRAETSQPDDVDIDMRPFSLDDIDIEGGWLSASSEARHRVRYWRCSARPATVFNGRTGDRESERTDGYR
jgi:hypothetical protein